MYALACPLNRPSKSDREADGLVGPVQTVQSDVLRPTKIAWLFTIQRRMPHRCVFYNQAGNKTKVIHYERGSEGSEIYRYHPADRLAEAIIQHNSTITRKTYTYDDSTHRVEIREEIVTKERTIRRRYISTFNDQGLQIGAGYDDDSSIHLKAFYQYTYDDDGRVTTIQTYNEKGSRYHKLVFDYDPDGRVIAEASYGPNDTLYEQRAFNYAIDERTEDLLVYKDDNDLHLKDVYRYNDKDNLVEVTAYSATSAVLGRTSYTYQYDEIGNWVEKVARSWIVETGRASSKWTEYQTIRYWQ